MKLLFMVPTLCAIVMLLPADTQVPVRGPNTVAKGTFRIPEVSATALYRYTNTLPPPPPNFPAPLPTNTLARLRWIADGVYAVDCDPDDILILSAEPKIRRTKQGKWQLSFP